MKAQLIILNQTVTPQFARWAKQFAEKNGPVELWSGDLSDEAEPKLVIRNSPRYSRRSSMSRLLAWGRYTIVALWRLIGCPQQVPIFVTSNPPLAPLMVWLFHRLRQQPYVVLEWDIYPQIAEVMSIMSSHNIFYKLWYQWHGRVLRDARAVITISDSMAEELRSMVNERSINVAVIPSGADTERIRPMAQKNNQFAQEHGITDQIVISYSGNMGETHAIESILELARQLSSCPNIVFMISGQGSKRKLIEDAVASGSYPNLRLLSWIPEDQFAQKMACTDISIVTLAHGYEKLSLPSKVYSSLAAGNAILSISREPNDLASLVRRHQCGENFAPDDTDEMTAWVLELARDHDRLRTYQTAARAAAVAHYSETICTARINAVLMDYLLLS